MIPVAAAARIRTVLYSSTLAQRSGNGFDHTATDIGRGGHALRDRARRMTGTHHLRTPYWKLD